MKIEIINKNEFYKYKDIIDSIHLENAYPNGYLIDDDYLTNADKNDKAKDFYLKNNFVISGVWSTLEYKGIKNPKSYFYSYKVK